MAKTTKPKNPPPPKNQEEQSKRFFDAVRELVDAGELNPTEAEERFERAVNKLASGEPSKRP